jgi:tetratricopeptide (TPR) repeat protein
MSTARPAAPATATRTDRQHLWLTGPTSAVRLDLAAALTAGASCVVDGHRGLRGPYTAAGSVLRSIADDALGDCPEIVARHDTEILTAAPELRSRITASRESLTSAAAPEERTRFYPGAHAQRVAHGLVEFLAEYAGARHPDGWTIVVDHADEADVTDAQFLATLVRRVDPSVVRVVLAGATRGLIDPEFSAVCLRHTENITTSSPRPAATDSDPAAIAATGTESGAVRADAELFVRSDGTSDDPALALAYHGLEPAERAALHDQRAAELESTGEPSWRLGAIAYHREHGTDPAGAGVTALFDALERCVLMGFYDAVLDLGARCQALLDWATEPQRCWLVTAKVCTALTAMGRPDEAAEQYDLACAATTDPSVHLQAAYGRAMLYTRFYETDKRDHALAKAWINTAISISSLLPDEQTRAFNVTFNENGLALIEMHLGDLRQALRLVTDGLQRLEREFGPEHQSLHQSVLLYNRAQLLAALGPASEALAEYGRLIAADPHHSEYRFERAAIHRRLGDVDAALEDYAAAMRLSPPYPEPWYNRADLLLELGDVDAAIADLDYVIDLDPTYLDAYVNRAGAYEALGELAAAADDVAAGLALSPEQPHLLCLQGVIAADQGDRVAARDSFDHALRVDPRSVAALSNRAVLRYQEGDPDGAIADLTAALALSDDPALRSNRALAYRDAGHWTEAEADYTAALTVTPDDDELHLGRGICRRNLGDDAGAVADLRACADGPVAGQARQELNTLVLTAG